MNVLADWDGDGEWGGSQSCGAGGTAEEHLLVDQVVPPGFNNNLSALNPPDFVIGAVQEWTWVRFTITDTPIGAGWDGSGTFSEGETEDYLIPVDPATGAGGDLPDYGLIQELRNVPNPFNPRTTISFELTSDVDLSVRVLDAGGRVVRRLHEGPATAGRQEMVFDGRADDGGRLASGVYLAEVRAGNQSRSLKLLMLK